MFPIVLLLREGTKPPRTWIQQIQQPTASTYITNARTLPVASRHEQPGIGPAQVESDHVQSRGQVEDDDVRSHTSEDSGDVAKRFGDHGREVPMSRVESFFSELYARVVWRYRRHILASGLVLVLLSLVLVSTRLEVSRELPALFARGEHNLGDAPVLSGQFGDSRWTGDMQSIPMHVCNTTCNYSTGTHKLELPDSAVAEVAVVFGVPDPLERDDSSKEGLDFSKAAVQSAAAHLCDLALERKAELAVRRTECFFDDFKHFLQDQNCNGCDFPIGSNEAHSLVIAFLKDANFRRKKWYRDFGFSEDGAHVAWFRVRFITDIPNRIGSEDAMSWSRRWDDFIDEFNKAFEQEPSVSKVFHSSRLWVRAEFETRLISATLSGSLICLISTFVAISVFLGHPVLAMLLTASVMCIITCLAGIVFGLIGWPFGAIEALELLIVLGLSVDYSLHTVEAYNRSAATQRFLRIRDALQRTGGALFGAAATSVLACPPLLFCAISVFHQFAAIIMLNVTLSLLLSLGFLVALLAIFGPMQQCWPQRRRVPPAEVDTQKLSRLSDGVDSPSDSPLREQALGTRPDMDSCDLENHLPSKGPTMGVKRWCEDDSATCTSPAQPKRLGRPRSQIQVGGRHSEFTPQCLGRERR